MEEYQIGYKLYKNEKTNEKYANMAVWCNDNNATIEDKGEYYEIVEIIPHTPTLKEQLEKKEQQYQMNRWQREIILAEGSGASNYAKDKAQELENLAEQIRNIEGGQNG